MKSGYFGPYINEHTRTRTVLKGLRSCGVEVVECNYRSSNRIIDYVKILGKLSPDFDAIILGARGDYYGQPLVPLVKKITRKPVVFDAVLALYETSVIDRQIYSPSSMAAKLLYYLDYYAFQTADLVLCDTLAHINYYSQMYNVDYKKFSRLLISSDETVFYPRTNDTHGKTVHETTTLDLLVIYLSN